MAGLLLNFNTATAKRGDDATTVRRTQPRIRVNAGSWTAQRRLKRVQAFRNVDGCKEGVAVTAALASDPPAPSPTPPTHPPRHYISSLFSAHPLPVPSALRAPRLGSKQCVPSNAALASLSLAAPELGVHVRLSEHLASARMQHVQHPTGIQALSWTHFLGQNKQAGRGRDVVLQSETGSGKTLAYLVPIVQDLLQLPTRPWSRDVGVCAVILVPTRELAEQVTGVAIRLLGFDGKGDTPDASLGHSRWLVPGTLHGGTNRTHEKARLRKGLPLLVCTPGRFLDHLEKTKALRFVGDPPPALPSPNDSPLKPCSPDWLHFAKFGLRWLIVDEADRLMDLGFEEQMQKILKHITDCDERARSYWGNRQVDPGVRDNRKTILCSATMPEKVERLVNVALQDPIVLSGFAQESDEKQQKTNTSDPVEPSTAKLAAPSQLDQKYVITPSKLRLVLLVSLLRRLTRNSKRGETEADKILVFVSCTAAVDFLFETLSGVTMGRGNDNHFEDEEEADGEGKLGVSRTCALLPKSSIHRLHGNLALSTRLDSLSRFSALSTDGPSILLCTSLASRGLDVPRVSHVIQYDLPTEGGVAEYLHRIGRTARAGKRGEAWTLLMPTEEGWVDWCEKGQERENIMQQVGVEHVITSGLGGGEGKEWKTRATDVQMAIERWVHASPESTSFARNGYLSHLRAYATHPSNEKQFFHVKNLHLGHLAKSFGLREPPRSTATSALTRSTLAANQNKRKYVDDDDQPNGFTVLGSGRASKRSNVMKGPSGLGADEFNIVDVSNLF